jgi:hypothetical protein
MAGKKHRARHKTGSKSLGQRPVVSKETLKFMRREQKNDSKFRFEKMMKFDETKENTANKDLQLKWKIEDIISRMAQKLYRTGKYTWGACVQAVKTDWSEMKAHKDLKKEIIPLRVKIKTKDISKYSGLVTKYNQSLASKPKKKK